jgi:hypothetical protein
MIPQSSRADATLQIVISGQGHCIINKLSYDRACRG